MSSQNKIDALFLSRNARDFLRLPASIDGLDRDQRVYFLAISIELSFKAYLRHTGMTDDETRKFVRHDLVKASRLAAARGFYHPTSIENEVIEAMSRRYVSGGFRRPPPWVWSDAFVQSAAALASKLNDRVSLCLAG